MPYHSAFTISADLSKTGILPYLYSPPLIIRQVKVTDIKAMQGKEVDVTADVRNGKEMPRNIEMKSPPAEARRIIDSQAGHMPWPGLNLVGKNALRQ